MPLKPRWAFIFLVLTAGLCFADEDHEMEEFLKREYSLSKPYQGNAAWRTGGDGRCFQNRENKSDLQLFCCNIILVWFTGLIMQTEITVIQTSTRIVNSQ